MNHAEALEKVRRHHLESHQRECQVCQTQSFIRQFFKLRVIGKERYCQIRHEFRDDESDTAHNGGTDYRQFENPLYPGVFPGSEIISRDRLHSLVEAHVYHNEKERDTVHDTVRADGKVSAVLEHLLIDEQRDDGRRERMKDYL